MRGDNSQANLLYTRRDVKTIPRRLDDANAGLLMRKMKAEIAVGHIDQAAQILAENKDLHLDPRFKELTELALQHQLTELQSNAASELQEWIEKSAIPTPKSPAATAERDLLTAELSGQLKPELEEGTWDGTVPETMTASTFNSKGPLALLAVHRLDEETMSANNPSGAGQRLLDLVNQNKESVEPYSAANQAQKSLHNHLRFALFYEQGDEWIQCCEQSSECYAMHLDNYLQIPLEKSPVISAYQDEDENYHYGNFVGGPHGNMLCDARVTRARKTGRPSAVKDDPGLCQQCKEYAKKPITPNQPPLTSKTVAEIDERLDELVQSKQNEKWAQLLEAGKKTIRDSTATDYAQRVFNEEGRLDILLQRWSREFALDLEKAKLSQSDLETVLAHYVPREAAQPQMKAALEKLIK
jgi:hypothetical protein